MKCPTDGTLLVMTERQGIEIDYCPQCRGIWLDRGELEKLLERSNALGGQAQTHSQGLAPRPPAQLGQKRDSQTTPTPQKDKNFLDEVFNLVGLG